MSEPSNETNEVFRSVGDAVRGAAFVALEAGIMIATRRAELAREARAESDAAARRFAERVRAEREAAMPVMRQPWNERWWKRATPEQIGKVWETTTSWAANGDPYAQATMAQIRGEVAARYGVTLPDGPMTGAELTDVLGAGTENARTEARRDRDTEEFASGPQRSYEYRISKWEFRNEADSSVVVASGVVEVDHDDIRAPELVGAETLLASPRGDTITLTENGKALCTLDRDQAESVREQARERYARILAGEEQTSPQELQGVLEAERDRLSREIADNNPRVASAREQLDLERAARGLPDIERTDEETAARSPAEAAERTADAREHVAQLNIRLDAVGAELRGEDGSQIQQAAALRASLDEEWWSGVNAASPAEVAGVWDHVAQWSDGRAKQEMRGELRAGIARTYGVEIPDDATKKQVAQAVNATVIDEETRGAYRYVLTGPGHDGRERVAAGITRPREGESERQMAHRVLRAYLGDTDQHDGVKVEVYEPGGQQVATATVQDLDTAEFDRAEAVRLGEQGRDEDGEAVLAGDTATLLDGTEDAALADAQASVAGEQRDNAAQDRDAAAALEEVGDAEAVEAVSIAGQGWSKPPSDRLAQHAPRRAHAAAAPRPAKAARRQPDVER